jgi:hypothetical protein
LRERTRQHYVATSRDQAGDLLIGEPCERRVSRGSRETALRAPKSPQVTDLRFRRHLAADAVSRAVERFAEQ